MEHILHKWEKVAEFLNGKYIFIFLDYDGTIAPIRKFPANAIISKEMKKLLLKLSRAPRCKLAIISGRALKDVKRMVGIKGIIYAGNHGLEIEDSEINTVERLPLDLRQSFKKIKTDLAKHFSNIKGMFVEDKGLTLSVHYRLAKEKNISLIKEIVQKVTNPFTIEDKVKVNSGKKVFEIKPATEWNKGEIVLQLLAKEYASMGHDNIMPVYLGDDTTDEDAFHELKNKGITVFVGKQKTSGAMYYLRNIKEVKELLRRISNL